MHTILDLNFGPEQVWSIYLYFCLQFVCL